MRKALEIYFSECQNPTNSLPRKIILDWANGKVDLSQWLGGFVWSSMFSRLYQCFIYLCSRCLLLYWRRSWLYRGFFYGVGGPKGEKLLGRLGTMCASVKKQTVLTSLILGSLMLPYWGNGSDIWVRLKEEFGRKF